MPVFLEGGTTGIESDVDIARAGERAVGRRGGIIGIDDRHGIIGTASVLSSTVGPIKKSENLKRINENHGDTRGRYRPLT